jgi:uroporphyrinogen-III synthase
MPLKTGARAIMNLIEEERIDLVILTSPSAAGVYAKMLKKSSVKKFHGPIIAAIGPVTGRAAAGYGLKVMVEARPHTDEGLVRAIVNFWRGKRKAKSAHRRTAR